jgi:hypothetical protein
MSTTGAIPEVQLAILESDQHHLREQADIDRRRQAARNRSLSDKLDAVEEATTKNALAVAGIVASLRTLKWMVATILPTCVAAAWALGRLLK